MKGMFVRLERVRRGLTQAEVASRLGISQMAVSKIERGLWNISKDGAMKIRQLLKTIDEEKANGKTSTADTKL